MTTLDNGVPIPEAAQRLGVSAKTIRRRIKAGELRAYEVATRHGPAKRVILPAPLDTIGDGGQSRDNAAIAAVLLYFAAELEQTKARLAALEGPAHGPPRPPPVLPREVIAETPSTRMGTVVKAVDNDAAPLPWWRRVFRRDAV